MIMKWIGLTGGIGTGKSTVSQILRQKGLPILNADIYGHKALEKPKVIQKVLSSFGESVLKMTHPSSKYLSIDRKSLRNIVFKDPQKRAILEEIVHPIIATMAFQEKKHLEEIGTPLAIYDAALIFEQNIQDTFDFIVLVATSRDIIYKRLKESRQMTKEMIDCIMDSQKPQEEKLNLVDFVIWNNGSIEDLKISCDDLLNKLS